MAIKVRPLHDRIIVLRLDEDDEQQVGSIIIPDTAKEKPQRGKIVAIGTGKTDDAGKKIALNVKKGDSVLYGKYSGTEVRLDDEDYLIMPEGDILAIIE